MTLLQVQFHEEKKIVITNILDMAVKKLNFDQKDYVKIKATLMQIIEKPGNEKVGLGKVVNLTNMMISKVAGNSGYVIVESAKHEEDDSAPDIATDVVIEEKEVKKEVAKEAEKDTGKKPSIAQGSVVHTSKERQLNTKEPTTKGKENILKLVRFLPPLISTEEMELYSARIRSARVGPATGAVPARTTGDIEKELLKEVQGEYADIYDGLVKDSPQAFLEKIVMASGKTREDNISEKLRKQLTNVYSLAEFLSIKDMVERLVKEHNKPKKTSNESSGLFFWRKK